MTTSIRAGLLLMLSIPVAHAAGAQTLPSTIERKLPADFTVLTYQGGDLNRDGNIDYIVALASDKEQSVYEQTGEAMPRPLLIFMGQKNGSYRLAARNDQVVPSLCCQCDPFDPENDPDDEIVVKGSFFTVQSEVACGAHWQDYLTFRYDKVKSEFLFYRDSYQSWSFNTDDSPGADALVSDGIQVKKSDASKPMSFSQYKPDA